MTYHFIDSFSGAGGLSLGLTNAGLNPLLSFDKEKLFVETQKKNPKYINHRVFSSSIDEMLNSSLLELANLTRGELFLLAGGPPCQGFSVQRIGSDKDLRNDLVLRYMDLVDELLPDYFLMENVAGIRGKRGKEILDLATSRASELGYKVYFSVLNAQHYGVPQRRKRAFLLGEKILPSANSNLSFEFPTGDVDVTITVRETIEHLPVPPLDGSDHPRFSHHRRDRLSPINIERLKALKPGQGREHLPEHLLANCHRRSAAKIGHRNVYGRMHWDDVAPTITARFDSFTRGLFGHPEQNRSITLREGALLQTFPVDYMFAGNKVEVARQIGNAVPPLLAEAIGKQILHYHKSKFTDDISRVS